MHGCVPTGLIAAAIGTSSIGLMIGWPDLCAGAARTAQVGQDSPGPGSYVVPAALGPQQLSTRKSAGTFKMPHGKRFVDGDSREAAQKASSSVRVLVFVW